MLIGLLTFAWLPTNANAATFVVDVFRDTVDAAPGNGVCSDRHDNCSLRAAVMEANAWPGWDTVELPAGDFRLTAPGPGERGEDLDVLGDLTIHGAGKLSTSISGEGMYRVIRAEGSALTIRDLTLRGGNAVGDDGGNIYADGALNLLRVRLLGGAAVRGGCIYSEGPVVLEHVTAESCTSGLYAAGTAELSDTVIRNTFPDGAAYFFGSTTVLDSMFEDNPDGAIYSNAGVEVTNVVFRCNGTALDVPNGDVTVRNSRFEDGGNGVSARDGWLLVEDSHFEGNLGVAVYGKGLGTAVLRSDFVGNSPVGALVELSADLLSLVADCRFIDNTTAGDSYDTTALGIGAGMMASVRNVEFRGNDTALAISSDDGLVTDTLIEGSLGRYPAVGVRSGTVKFSDVTVRGTVQGGAMSIDEGAVVTVEDSQFVNNTLSYVEEVCGYGYGGAYGYGCSYFCGVVGPHTGATSLGAGIGADDATLTVERTEFVGNAALGGICDGGAITFLGGDLTVRASTFRENYGTLRGAIDVGY